MTATTPDATPTPPAGKPPRRDQTKLVAGGAAIALFVVFALINTQQVRIHWVVTTTRTPLIVALLIAAALGAAAVYGFSYTRRRRSRKRSRT
jgi:uncharacterized integral membrane protein